MGSQLSRWLCAELEFQHPTRVDEGPGAGNCVSGFEGNEAFPCGQCESSLSGRRASWLRIAAVAQTVSAVQQHHPGTEQWRFSLPRVPGEGGTTADRGS